MKALLLLPFVAFLAGCSFMEGSADRAIRYVQEGVDYYCTAPEDMRQYVRERVNPTPDGNTLSADCAQRNVERISNEELAVPG